MDTSKINRIAAIVDADLAANARHGPESNAPCPCAAAMTACLHAAVREATLAGVDRATIECRAGMGRTTLGEYLSVKAHARMRAEQLARMMFDPSVLGDRGFAVLWRELMCFGQRALGEIAAPAAAGELGGVFLDVADALGAVAEHMRAAQGPESPGGSAITPMEHVRIGGAARVVIEDTTRMIPSSIPGREAHA